MSLLPSRPGRWIDPRGQRFSAGLSAVLLLLALLVDAPLLVAAIALAMGTSSAFGMRYWALGKPWPIIRRVLRLGPTEPEHELPPRFAQALGTTCLALAVILFVLGLEPWAWLPVVGVIALQTVLAVTGYCLGCRMYGLKWIVPALFDRFVARLTGA
jgi:hypothetical protein